jgi:membrane-anchored protein YejM (alkaline phosphatase superfamily)
MKAASLNELKKELYQLSAKELVEFCLSLAKYKKDNKEFLGYLLFESHDKATFVNEIKSEIDLHFLELESQSNLYYIKKSLRKLLRLLTKYGKYIGDKAIFAELHIYFCLKLIASGIPLHKSQLLVNMYEQQVKKINTAISTLHEDLQSDFNADLEKISTY